MIAGIETGISGIEISQEKKVATGMGCELIMQIPP